MKNFIKEQKAYEIIITIYLAVVLFGLPLVVHNGYYNIDVAKYYFYCGASVLLVPVLILKLKERLSVKEFFQSLSIAEKALLIYWIISALSTLLSQYRFEAFWGNEGRFSGLMLMSIYVAAYFLITRCYKPHFICMYLCILAGSLVFIFGITDYFNLNLFHFKDIIAPKYAPIFMSTIGNINFYSSYGVLIIGLVATLYTTWSTVAGATVYFLLMILSFLGLIVGNSDSTYLAVGALLAFLPLYLFQSRQGIRRYFMMVSGLLFSFMVVKVCDIYLSDIVLKPDGIRAMIGKWNNFLYLCLGIWGITAAIYIADYIFHRKEKDIGRKMQIIWVIILAAVVMAIIGILIDANFLGHAKRYGNLRSYVVFDDNWGTHRGYAWRKAVETYKNFPILRKLLGNGPDTFGIISFFRDLAESEELYGEFFDSVHNEYLQFLVTIGPVATVGYIVFLILSIWDMIKSHYSPYVMGAGFGVLCYCIQAVVNINQPIATPIMWTLLAMGIAEYREGKYRSKKDSEHV